MCRELTATTGIDIVTLKNVLGSMLFAKDLMVLKKTPKSKAIELDHVIEIDPAYKNPNLVGSRRLYSQFAVWEAPCACCDRPLEVSSTTFGARVPCLIVGVDLAWFDCRADTCLLRKSPSQLFRSRKRWTPARSSARSGLS